MAKKKEDLGGVWRTVGGRRIFIKDGQDLYEAMNDSGKFTNLKRTNKAKQGVKEIDYIGQDGKKHKMDSYEYPEDRDGYHKYLTEKYGTYKEEEIKDKNGRTDYKKLREEFYQHQEKTSYKVDGKTMSEQDLRKEFDKELERGNIEKGTTYHEWKKGIVDDRNSNVKSESGYIEKRRKEIEFEQKKGIYTGARETDPDGSYKHQKEMDAEDTITSLRKADNWNDINSAIDNIKDEKLKAMMKKEAQKLEENENGAWKSADYLAREYNFYKEDFERENKEKYEYELYKKAREDENSIDPMTENSTDWEELDRKYKDRYEKELNSKTNTNITKDDIYTDKNGAKIGHSMVVQYATMNHLTIEEAKKILGVK